MKVYVALGVISCVCAIAASLSFPMSAAGVGAGGVCTDSTQCPAGQCCAGNGKTIGGCKPMGIADAPCHVKQDNPFNPVAISAEYCPCGDTLECVSDDPLSNVGKCQAPAAEAPEEPAEESADPSEEAGEPEAADDAAPPAASGEADQSSGPAEASGEAEQPAESEPSQASGEADAAPAAADEEAEAE